MRPCCVAVPSGASLSGQSPYSSPQPLDRAPDVGVRDAAAEQLADDRRLGDVLDAVDARLAAETDERM